MQGQLPKSSIFSENPWVFNVLPKNHLLKFIMDMLDLSFIKSLTENSYHKRMGRPSVDPEIFFRMTLIGYLYGIKSDRRLCEENSVQSSLPMVLLHSLRRKGSSLFFIIQNSLTIRREYFPRYFLFYC